MSSAFPESAPIPRELPVTLPREGAVNIELEQGVPVFRVARVVQERIEDLLEKNRATGLTDEESRELTRYEEIDDYLSYLNRLTRNLNQHQNQVLGSIA